MTRNKMLYAITQELVDRMSREELESLAFEQVFNDLDNLPDGDLENEYDRVFAVEVSDGQPDEAQEWYDFDPDC